MGKGSGEIQRDIERQRRSLSDRIDRLDSRVRDDVQTVRDEATSRAQSLADRAKSTVSSTTDTAKGKASDATNKLPGSDSKFAEHPNLLLLGSFTAGIVAGMVTGGGGEEEPERPKRQMPEHIHGQSEGEGMIASKLSGNMDKARGLVAGQLSAVLGDVLDNLMERAKEASKEAADSTSKDDIPHFLKSAWDSFSGRREDTRPRETAGSHLEMHDRDLPSDRPLSDLEERSAEDMGISRS